MNNMAPEPLERDGPDFEPNANSQETEGEQPKTVPPIGEWGVWGSMTERERSALLKRRNGSSFFEQTEKPQDPSTDNTE